MRCVSMHGVQPDHALDAPRPVSPSVGGRHRNGINAAPQKPKLRDLPTSSATFSTVSVKSGKPQSEHNESGLPPLADMEWNNGLMRCSKNGRYSTVLSISNSIVAGILSPSAFAVVRLIVNSNLLGCWIDKSAGLAPLRILATY